jgi:hypothetical protein
MASIHARYPGRFRLTVLAVDFDGQAIVAVEDGALG